MSFIPYQITHDGKDWYAWYNEPIWKTPELDTSKRVSNEDKK